MHQVELTLTIRGTERPLLMHSSRLADPFDQYTQQIAKISRKRQKTVEDYSTLAMLETRGSAWETDDGLLGIPNRAVWRAVQEAGTATKKGTAIKRALHFEDIIVPLTIDGEKVAVKDYFHSLTNHENMFYTTVVVNKKRTMRARAMVRNWASTHTFTLNESELDFETLRPVIYRAADLIGLGDWRPTYGSFEILEVTK